MPRLLITLTLLLVVSLSAAAQEGLPMYLIETDNIKARIAQTRSGFGQAMLTRNKARDIARNQALTKEYVVVWAGLKRELGEIQCPKQAQEYHKILGLVVDLQLESCISMRDFATNILEGKAQVTSLREQNASEEIIQSYLDQQSKKNKNVVRQLDFFKELIPQIDKALAEERQSLK